MIFIGIDPGTTGYITLYEDDYEEYVSHQIPLKNGRLDSSKLFGYIECFHIDHFLTNDVYEIYVEDVHSIFGMSAKSNFTFGSINGAILAVCDMFENVKLVQPKEWQKEMHKGIEKNKDKKVMSLQAAQKLFPTMDFKRTERCTTPDHNLIDSLLICEYAKRKFYENRP
jgi:hypothetical protein